MPAAALTHLVAHAQLWTMCRRAGCTYSKDASGADVAENGALHAWVEQVDAKAIPKSTTTAPKPDMKSKKKLMDIAGADNS